MKRIINANSIVINFIGIYMKKKGMLQSFDPEKQARKDAVDSIKDMSRSIGNVNSSELLTKEQAKTLTAYVSDCNFTGDCSVKEMQVIVNELISRNPEYLKSAKGSPEARLIAAHRKGMAALLFFCQDIAEGDQSIECPAYVGEMLTHMFEHAKKKDPHFSVGNQKEREAPIIDLLRGETIKNKRLPTTRLEGLDITTEEFRAEFAEDAALQKALYAVYVGFELTHSNRARGARNPNALRFENFCNLVMNEPLDNTLALKVDTLDPDFVDILKQGKISSEAFDNIYITGINQAVYQMSAGEGTKAFTPKITILALLSEADKLLLSNFLELCAKETGRKTPATHAVYNNISPFIQAICDVKSLIHGSERQKMISKEAVEKIHAIISDPAEFILSNAVDEFGITTDKKLMKAFLGNKEVVGGIREQILNIGKNPSNIKWRNFQLTPQQEEEWDKINTKIRAEAEASGSRGYSYEREIKIHEAKSAVVEEKHFAKWFAQPEQRASFKEYLMGNAAQGNPFFDVLVAPKHQQQVAASTETPSNSIQEGVSHEQTITPTSTKQRGGKN
jgi:hypothetical protein